MRKRRRRRRRRRRRKSRRRKKKKKKHSKQRKKKKKRKRKRKKNMGTNLTSFEHHLDKFKQFGAHVWFILEIIWAIWAVRGRNRNRTWLPDTLNQTVR